MKYGPGLKSIVYVHSWNQVAFAYNQDKDFFHRPRKVIVAVLNEDSTAVSKALSLERQKKRFNFDQGSE